MKTRSTQTSSIPRHHRLRHCVATAALLLGTVASGAWAQTPALTPATSQGSPVGRPGATPALTVPATPASAASAARPTRRYLSSDEKRESATTPGDLRPTDQVVPQIRIPIGRNPASAVDSASAAGVGDGIDDDAARCRAQASPADRTRCGAGAQKVLPKPTLRPQ